MAELFAYIGYRDAPRALTWLEALGFETVRRQDGDDGAVIHAEVRLGDAVLMLSTADAQYGELTLVGHSTGSGLYLCTEDVDSIYAAAIGAQGTGVLAPEDTEWGTRRARVLDPEGHEWSFGSYRPGSTW